ncbi:hypothetical protein [Gynuella sp.]|uniref:hypothetical protein n=1 Tax=Gynuella sp. TaxID=2969146 RepID=UPI003D132912
MLRLVLLVPIILLSGCISTRPDVIRSSSLDDAAETASRENPDERHLNSDVTWNEDQHQDRPAEIEKSTSTHWIRSPNSLTDDDDAIGFALELGTISPSFTGRSDGRITVDQQYLARASVISLINDRWQAKLTASLGAGSADIDAPVKSESYLEWGFDLLAVRQLSPHLAAEFGAGYFGGAVYFNYQNPIIDAGQSINSDLLGYDGIRTPIGLTLNYGHLTTSLYALPELAFYNEHSVEGFRNDWQQVDYRIRAQWLFGWRF